MFKLRNLSILFSLAIILILLSGCLGKLKRPEINYYVLEYQNNSEDPKLVRPTNTGKILEVQNTLLPKTYDRNQIVVKESFYRVNFLPYDVWANKLRDAIPNLIAQRLRAYNIFGSISRGEQVDKNPHFYLETNVQNIEKIEGKQPQAYLKMEFVLRDSTGTRSILTHRTERYQDLYEPSMISLVQAFNDMLMEETNNFASKCLRYFTGTMQPERSIPKVISGRESYYYEKLSGMEGVTWGELIVNTKTSTEEQLNYAIAELDSLNNEVDRVDGIIGKEKLLRPGRYKVYLGDYKEVVTQVEIKPRQRTVVKPNWAELQVVILDRAKTRVRLSYDLWQKIPDGQGYTHYNTGISMGDDEIGSVDKLWILREGAYMVKVGGGSWSDLRNFATVPLSIGDRKVLTMIVDTSTNATNLMVGAGVFADDDIGFGSKRWHKGYLSGDIRLDGDNNVDKNKPSTYLTMKAKFENSIDLHDQIRPFHFTTRSIYDLGLNLSTGRDFHFKPDSYSLKSVLLYYPLEKKAFFKNFAFYGRGDLNTHFFDETTYFEDPTNFALLNTSDSVIVHQQNATSFKSKIAFYPLILREGTGLTYRLNLGSNTWLSLRGGYGWRQEYNQRSYTYDKPYIEDLGQGTHSYEHYKEEEDRSSKGLESTLILSSINLLNFLSINSTVDVLFPMGVEDHTYILNNENRVNFRLTRHLSIDVELNTKYDKDKKDWVVYDYSSYLQLSLFY